MKINHKTLSLIIASLCGTGASAYVQGQDTPKSASMASSGRIGDASGTTQQAGSSVLRNNTPKPINFQSSPAPVPQAAESYVGDGYYTGDYQLGGSGQDYGYGFNADQYGYASGYEYGAGESNCNVSRYSPYYTWIEVESLLWWGKSSNNAPEIVSGYDINSLSVISGGEGSPLGTGMMPGMRATLGTWIDNDQNYALTASVYGLFTGEDTTTYNGGSGVLGVSFFRPDFGPDYYLANYQTPTGYATGSIEETSELNFIGSDVSLRTLLIGDTASRADFILGYTFNRLDSSYGLRTEVTDFIPNSLPDGTVLTTTDSFGTKNEFHGAHLGLGTNLTSGRFSLGLTGKVALGQMKRSSNVSGKFTEARPGVDVYTENRGLFAQSTNSGSFSEKEFTFIPEANAKLKYRLGRGELGVGYSLLVFPKVAMATSQIDPTIDVLGIGSGSMTSPLPKYTTESFFLHGLDLGYTFKF